MSDRYSDWDAAYVLGALSEDDQREYEAHLADCPACADAVADLGELPGVLAMAEPWPGGATAEVIALPEGVRSGVGRRIGRARLRTKAVVAGSMATAAAAVIALVLVLALGGSGTTGSGQPAEQALAAVRPVPLQAAVTMTDKQWGTEIKLRCSYDRLAYGSSRTYLLAVQSRAGAWQTIGTWNAFPGKTARLDAATSLERDAIATVEIRTADNRPVMRLQS
ncbi:MAG: anti-sigma factor family protein [Mycobacteriales bacterium]